MRSDLASKVRSEIGSGVLAYLPITLANSLGAPTFKEALVDERTLIATGLVIMAKAGYDHLLKPWAEKAWDTFTYYTGW